MKFPTNIKIRIIDGINLNPIKIENVIINVHIFALNKNDYNLGPYFSNNMGEIHLTDKMLRISANAEMEACIMDYVDIKNASPLVEIKILSKEDIECLREGRKLWGVIGKEIDLYHSEKELLKKIDHNNNRYVLPASIKILWDDKVSLNVCYELKTLLSGNSGDSGLDPIK